MESPKERAWAEGSARTVAAMGAINLATAELVGTIRMLLETNGWHGSGINSIEHWVTWQAGVSKRRASDLVRIARRIDELPKCWALFTEGRLTEDAMVRISRRAPAERDAEIAQFAPGLLISQLTRVLKSCPEQPDGNPDPWPPEPQPRRRHFDLFESEEGWGEGTFCLPPDELAQLRVGLQQARDAEFRDRNGLDTDAEVLSAGSVTWADAFMRLAAEGLDALDPTLARTGVRGERTKVVLHHDIDPDGTFGPGQVHLGAVIPDAVARYLRCDAEVLVATYRTGQLVGINPTERTVGRNLRRAIERRDQGCTHPLCAQTRWLHVHHIKFWEDGGLTVPANLICLCPRHHRQLHHGEVRIEGDPQAGTLRFFDAEDRPIEPPEGGSPRPIGPDEPSPYTPPYGERLDSRAWSWN